MDQAQNSGSRWQRWDPHIHAPGTVLNDQFRGDWGAYLAQLEAADPSIAAIGVTDYYSTECYQQICEAKRSGRLPQCQFIFPNIEMRLGVGTVKGSWVNIHLLINPEESNHLEELQRFLARLNFGAHDDKFCCRKDDLILLGKKSDPDISDDDVALRRGSEQFKVSFDQLKEEFSNSGWAQNNILVAIAGGADGSSGVRDAADATLRQEVEKFADIIFSSNPSQQAFWLGQGVVDAAKLRSRYGGLKPCLHGSDAHITSQVGRPYEERYTWIKGEAAFDTLRHACIDPASRAHIGALPPASASLSQVISCVKISGASWARTPMLPINPGLVAVIGARGSGKTALADMIAAGSNAVSESPNQQSFLVRAADELRDTTVQLEWGSGDPTKCDLGAGNPGHCSDFPRARYLSQQFVEELCSATGMTDSLLREIERVVFEAHTLSSRENTVNFDELLDVRASRFRYTRQREEQALSNLSDRIAEELEKDRTCPDIKRQVKNSQTLILGYNKDREQLAVKGSEARMERLGAITAAAEKVRSYLRSYRNQQQALLSLKDEVADVRRNQAPETLRQSKERFRASRLKEDDWNSFLLDYKGDVDSTLAHQLEDIISSAAKWKGKPMAASTDVATALIPDDADLNRQPLSLLEAEAERLERLVNVDRVSAQKFSTISRRIAEESASLERLEAKLADCEQARQRANTLIEERSATYVNVFNAILNEQAVLEELYAPLMQKLEGAAGTLKKLSFSVNRVADVAGWAERAEENLFDRRRIGPFKGRGTLRQLAEKVLQPAWEHGDAKAVSEAMKLFRAENQDDLLELSRVPKAHQADFRVWLKQFAQWLFDTSHISIRYSIDYDGLDIRKLSPGTRGVVLLLLYLVLDDADDRPLIIDQPEENLDPQSIYQELVGLFVAAKSKRQVIMVTHNANLVVNTDADQIIVASSGPQPGSGLPDITYISGGLESIHIRKAVCDILEGGEAAFKERARRLRVRLER